MSHSIKHPITASWDVRTTKADFDKLKNGFRPQMMEDRWEIRSDDPDRQGTTVVHFYRSWTSTEQIALRVKSDNETAKVVEITWDQGDSEYPVTEADAKELAALLCKNLLGCKWTTPS